MLSSQYSDSVVRVRVRVRVRESGQSPGQSGPARLQGQTVTLTETSLWHLLDCLRAMAQCGATDMAESWQVINSGFALFECHKQVAHSNLLGIGKQAKAALSSAVSQQVDMI